MASGVGASPCRDQGPPPGRTSCWAGGAGPSKAPPPGLEEFLDGFKVSVSASPTHTRFGDAFGSYYIPAIESDNFFATYAKHVHRRRSNRSNRSVCIVERHAEHGPVVLDFDFRFQPSTGVDDATRRYRRDHVDRVLRCYLRELAAWVHLPAELDVYVMEKPGPKPSREGGLIKDGLHIVIPDAVTHPRVQLLVRRAVMHEMGCIMRDIGIVNTAEDAFDEAVIQRNGWMLYGSCKLGEPHYEVTRVERATFNCHREVFLRDMDEWRVPDALEGVEDLVRTLSVRNKSACLETRGDKLAEVQTAEAVEQLARAHIAKSALLQDSEAPRSTASHDDYDNARKMVKILDEERIHEYNSWMRVGWCLHNIDFRLLNSWIALSKLSTKFQAGLCEQLWGHMTYQSDGLGMGTLRMWARQDSPELYDAMMRDSMSGRVRAAITGTHHDVANVVANMFADRFVCTSVRNNAWYEFRNHRWKECDSGFTLRRFLSIDVYNRFTDEAAKCSARMQRISADDSRDDEHSRLASVQQKLTEIAKKLKFCSFKDAVMKECRELMYRTNFEGTLDSKPHLIGFENGIYDLDAHSFRDGSPEDMVCYSTKVCYTPFDPDNATLQNVVKFFDQIQPNPEVREYLLRLLASFLHGSIREERFHVWTGTGSNGKSITVELFEKALGDYCCKLPVSLLTQKRAASNAATSEIARCKGRRFACLQEPGNDEVLNVGLMKELTGGDRIMARALYREPFEFKPMMKMVLTANNLPEVRSDDGGTWRRIRVIGFDSQFVEHPDADQPNEFQLDNTLSQKLGDWAPHFFALLIEYFKIYMRSGNSEPLAVLSVTRQYRQNNDVVQMFIDHTLDITPTGIATAEAVHNKYKDFIKEHALFSYGSMKRNEVIQSVQKHSKCRVAGQGAHTKLHGVRLKPEAPVIVAPDAD